MKEICGVLLGVLCSAWLAGAETVSITAITPVKVTNGVTAVASHGGGVYVDRSPGFAVGNPPGPTSLSSDYYGITVTNLTVRGVSGVTMTFDLNLSVVTNATVKGVGIRDSGNFTYGYWVDVDGNNFSRFFNSGAVLTFSVTNVTIDKGLAVSSVSFRPEQPWGVYGNDGAVSANSSLAPVSWNPATGVLTACAGASGSEGAAVRGLGIDFEVNTGRSIGLYMISSK